MTFIENPLVNISIHAPRGGSDSRLTFPTQISLLFQSTLPVGGATLHDTNQPCSACISIHAPRGGSDQLQELPIYEN